MMMMNPNNTITSVLRPILLARQNGHTVSSFFLKKLLLMKSAIKRADGHIFQSQGVDSFKISPRK